MSAMYTALVYPQCSTGGNYARPSLPSTFVGSGPVLTTPTWNPFSANSADRTEWWEDTAGTLTYDDALLACYGLSGIQAQQTSSLRASYESAISTCPVTINGTAYTLALDTANATLNMAAALSAQQAISAPAWTANTAVTVGQLCTIGGVPLFCSTAGTTSGTAPTVPTSIGTSVSDGTAEWELFARSAELRNGTFSWFTASEIVSVGHQIELYLHQQKFILIGLLAQVQAATTVSAVQTVVWS